jgi:2-oxoglutarate/2-oxoacid ferredoxin oxidoreductase subunit alpha
MSAQCCTILIGGEAGQGLVTVGSLLSKALVREGFHIVVTQDYQSRIRGGHNTFAIRASGAPIAAPHEGIDLLLALNAETIALHQEKLHAAGLVVADEPFACQGERCLAVPFKELASGRSVNIAALGVAASLLGLSRETCLAVVHEAFGKKNAQVAEENEQALARAFEWAAGKRAPCDCLKRAGAAERRLLLNGNDAIALGAMSAGIKFYSFYPMTPSTSIGLALAANARRMGIVVEQAEDEIAAINMAIGASFAGAPSMVATSGGGFALMVEGVSLAGMTETPIVVVVGQRPAPATGLPTRTEQADLEFVLHAGHGEFPRAIFAPGTVEECFHLTRKAFELAERAQGPVFLLTD